MNTENHSQTAAFLWPIADLLRRIECVLETTKEAVIRESYAQASLIWWRPSCTL